MLDKISATLRLSVLKMVPQPIVGAKCAKRRREFGLRSRLSVSRELMAQSKLDRCLLMPASVEGGMIGADR